MERTLAQLPPKERIEALVLAVLACRARQARDRNEEAGYLELLAQAEAGLPAAKKSGLIDSNPYEGIPLAPPGFSGDLVDPSSGEPCGGSRPGGSR